MTPGRDAFGTSMDDVYKKKTNAESTTRGTRVWRIASASDSAQTSTRSLRISAPNKQRLGRPHIANLPSRLFSISVVPRFQECAG